MSAESRCATCSSVLTPGQRYCGSCGAPVSPSSALPTVNLPSGAAPASDRERFVPGTVLAGRYRIVGLLGRGGMGEVYRADDLKLGQPVALKFLSDKFASDRGLVERFYAEVRHARQVSHPNVCRVYDVGEIGGRLFLSMEHIDGEDLASLLRRIGRLSGERAVEIAREMVAGLAAAHDKGVLHRDLKPGNVMIDGRGRARITDFGLAVAAGEDAGGAEVSGTPAYMAPEQLAGKGSSVQSDLYALGLVLYELFTGKKAFEAATLAEWRRVHAQEPPTSPSAVAREIDPAVERVILRCLEKEPGQRPRSAAAVAAALPGGDPLAAAVAAGETPSPEMVAAAGESGAMKPAAALGFLAATLAGIALAAYLSPRAYLHGMVPLEKPPDALVERSQEVVRKLGYLERPVDSVWGIEASQEYLRWVAEHDKSRDRWKDLAVVRPAAVYFWYRQAPVRLIAERFRGDDFGWWAPSESDPPMTRSGMIGVELDTLGRLTRFEAVPSSPAPAPTAAPDWSTLFSLAGLDAADFAKSDPRWLPPFYADSRVAWAESKPKRPDRPMRIEAAALAGRPVYFELIGTWTRPARLGPHESGRTALFEAFGVGVLLLLIVAGSLAARRNLRLGRGDRRGAARLAAFLFCSGMLGWALYARHVASVSELPLFLSGVGFVLFAASLSWLLYVALEPILRRRWPDSLIAWTRLLSGRLTDPLVGRVILAGVLLGALEAVIWAASAIAHQSLEATPRAPIFVFPQTLLGPRQVAAHLFGGMGVSMFSAVANVFLFTVFRAVLKKDWLAAAAFVILFASPYNFLAGGPISVIAGVLVTAAYIVFFLRFGLLVLVVEDYVAHFLQFALTTDSSAWYAGTSLFLLVVLAAIAVYGFRTALAGQPLLSGARLDD